MRSDSQPAEVRAKLFDEEDLGANTTRLGIVASLGARDLQALRLLDIHRIARFAVNKGIGVVMRVFDAMCASAFRRFWIPFRNGRQLDVKGGENKSARELSVLL
jgi:predicted DNA-binding protein (UPF0251 family)